MSLETNPDLQRAVETPALRGDPSKIHAATGWTPEIALDTTLQDILDEHRDALAIGK